MVVLVRVGGSVSIVQFRNLTLIIWRGWLLRKEQLQERVSVGCAADRPGYWISTKLFNTMWKTCLVSSQSLGERAFPSEPALVRRTWRLYSCIAPFTWAQQDLSSFQKLQWERVTFRPGYLDNWLFGHQIGQHDGRKISAERISGSEMVQWKTDLCPAISWKNTIGWAPSKG